MSSRYTYAYGYRSFEAADAALEDCFATGEVLPGEFPEIESYRIPRGNGARSGATRYRITLAGA